VIPITTNATDGGTNGADGSPSSTSTGWLAGAPTEAWTNVTSNLAGLASQCGNMSYVSAKPDEDLLIAGIAEAGLWSSTNGGATWSPMGGGADASTPIVNRTSSIVYDPTNTSRYWESGLYNSNGVYETNDDGGSFMPLGDVMYCDLVAVDFTDPNRQTLLAGGHEQSQTLYRSADGGMTWTAVGMSLPPMTNCTFPLVVDAQTHLVGCGGFGGGVSGIYRTTDGATTWSNVTTLGGIDAPLVASDGSYYWSSPNGAGLARSTDKGVTWSNVIASPYSVGSYRPIELPDGRIVTIGPADGTAKYVVASADHGATWKPVSAVLPYVDATAVSYSAQRKVFYIWHFTCGSGANPVPSDAIMSYAFDYETN